MCIIIEGLLRAVVVLVLTCNGLEARDDGLALTPPMGWLAWERFRCNTDCTGDPENCISERLFMKMADIMAAEGYLAAGYNHVNVDECWTGTTRDAQGRLQPDNQRFPNGMQALGGYIHSLGLKYGLYTDYGTRTCNGRYPGSMDHLQIDAETFAAWGADYVKLDGCYADPRSWTMYGYPDMAYWLNRTGRPIVLGTEFPVYQINHGYPRTPDKDTVVPKYKALSRVCHVARNHADVYDSWDSVQDIIQSYAANKGDFASAAGPGFWNDPDMLIVGNYGLSYDQQQVQMAMWCMWAAPLLMSVDLRTVRAESKALLLNPRAIAINQDPLGVQATLAFNIGSNIQVWLKRLAEYTREGEHAYAFTVLNLGTDGMPRSLALTPAHLSLNNTLGYLIKDVWSGRVLGKYALNDTLQFKVNPTGVFFARAAPIH